MSRKGKVSDRLFAQFTKLSQDHVHMTTRMNILKKMLKDNNDLIETLKRAAPLGKCYRPVGIEVVEESVEQALPHFMAKKLHFETEIKKLTDLMAAKEHQINRLKQQLNLHSLGEKKDDKKEDKN